MQNTLQEQVANRIYELLPEKKEISFGCKVVTDEGYFRNVLEIEYEEDSDTPYKILVGANIIGFMEWCSIKDVEIIGHPIRLADILRAIEKVRQTTEDYEGVAVRTNGEILFINYSDYTEGLAEYNLSKDNILEQDTAFCEFLLEIIK